MEALPAEIVRIEKIIVERTRIVVQLSVDEHFSMSTPALGRALRQRFPRLEYHVCVNEYGRSFGACMDKTPLVHVLEHLIIDFEVCADEAAGGLHNGKAHRRFVGLSHARGASKTQAQIELSYFDDLETLAAIKQAHKALNELAREAWYEYRTP